MKVEYLILGILLGTQLPKLINVHKKEEEMEFADTQYNNNKIIKTVKFKKQFKITKDSPKMLKPEDISINVGPKNPGEKKANSHLLSTLWAYFQAYQMGLLEEDNSIPWEGISKERIESSQEENPWYSFLSNIVDDELPQWIRNPEEIKKRTIDVCRLINS
ncbi:hypothetical protein [Natronospora cellulosivora (SeqCode)]